MEELGIILQNLDWSPLWISGEQDYESGKWPEGGH